MQGYILKGSQIREVVDAVLAIHAGNAYVSPQLAGKLLLAIRTPPQPSALDTLTDRERGILGLVAEGLPNKAIAARLDLAEKTVKHHMTSLMRKLGVRSRVEAALVAQRQGLT
ncbi:MAG: response regulator transcription factor [Caldilineaceae bacterium]|nr:response regulator transcription factor [Caldilineaceae bacterium]MBP8108790.1 response regulator transcription factor [Caldilineaceae bacterium]MBP8123960.1 response regulator transcription factor [Caldilineaceae bacterium]MBP9073449.1 response regulator transcription factor [Caldilineaceae bacterium]